jgi:hypothetical protein
VSLATRFLTLAAHSNAVPYSPRTVSNVSGTWSTISTDLTFTTPQHGSTVSFYNFTQARSGYLATAVFYANSLTNGPNSSTVEIRSWDNFTQKFSAPLSTGNIITTYELFGNVPGGYPLGSIYAWCAWSHDSRYLTTVEWTNQLTYSNLSIYENNLGNITYRASANVTGLISETAMGPGPITDYVLHASVEPGAVIQAWTFNGNTLSSRSSLFSGIPQYNRWGNLALVNGLVNGIGGGLPYSQTYPADSAYNQTIGVSLLSTSQSEGSYRNLGQYVFQGLNDVARQIYLDGQHSPANAAPGGYSQGITVVHVPSYTIANTFPSLAVDRITWGANVIAAPRGGYNNISTNKLANYLYLYNNMPGYYDHPLYGTQANAWVSIYSRDNNYSLEANVSLGSAAYNSNQREFFAWSTNYEYATLSGEANLVAQAGFYSTRSRADQPGPEDLPYVTNDYVTSGYVVYIANPTLALSDPFASLGPNDYIQADYAQDGYFTLGASAERILGGTAVLVATTAQTAQAQFTVSAQATVAASHVIQAQAQFTARARSDLLAFNTVLTTTAVVLGATLSAQTTAVMQTQAQVTASARSAISTQVAVSATGGAVRSPTVTVDTTVSVAASAAVTRSITQDLASTAVIFADPTVTILASAGIVSTATQTTTAVIVTNSETNLASTITLSATANASYSALGQLISEDFVTLQAIATLRPTVELSSSSALQATAEVNYSARSDISSQFTVVAQGLAPVIIRANAHVSGIFSQVSSAGVIRASAATDLGSQATITARGTYLAQGRGTFTAMDFVLGVSRIVHIPIALQLRVPYEERILDVIPDTRGLWVPYEERVNTISTELRDLAVPAEDRELDANY